MSVRNSVYIGPYVEATPRLVEDEQEVYGCKDPACKGYAERGQKPSYASAREFCGTCGARKATSTKKFFVERPLYELVEDELCERLRRGSRMFITPNGGRRWKGVPEGVGSMEEESCSDLTDVDARLWLAWFEDAYSKELGVLRENYDEVRVRWGLLCWWS